MSQQSEVRAWFKKRTKDCRTLLNLESDSGKLTLHYNPYTFEKFVIWRDPDDTDAELYMKGKYE